MDQRKIDQLQAELEKKTAAAREQASQIIRQAEAEFTQAVEFERNKST